MPEKNLRSGTVVLQYIDDRNRCVAVVVEDHMRSRIQGEQVFGPNYHVCLVLGWFSDKPTQSIFNARTFPHYIIANRNEAFHFTDQDDQAGNLERYSASTAGSKFGYAQLYWKIFAPSDHQREVLELATLINSCDPGAGVKGLKMPPWMEIGRHNAEAVFKELEVALRIMGH